MLRLALLVLSLLPLVASTARADDSADDLLRQARAALAKKQLKEALDLLDRAIERDPKHVNALLLRGVIRQSLHEHDKAIADFDKVLAIDSKLAGAYYLRGKVHEDRNEHDKAIADFDRAIECDPKGPEAYDHRGSEHFKLGHIKESLANFDRFLELRPKEKPGHWKRGISLYYAGQYDEGRKQFEGYEEVDTNDVENAVWHFLCVARKDGVEKARKSLLKIGKDTRVPMMQVYELFAGKAKPEDVLAAAREGKPAREELNTRLFYAHLYLGLFAEVSGNKKEALEHLTKAADDHKIGHYMWDVARVHRDLLRMEKK